MLQRHRTAISGMALPLLVGGALILAERLGAAPVDEFKTFLASPPIVESIVFSRRQPPDPKDPWRKDVEFSSSTTYRHYFGRWQPGSLFLRELAAADSLSDNRVTGLLAAKADDQCWFHYGTDRRVSFGTGPTNRVCWMATNNSVFLPQILMMGIMHANVGSVQWDGIRFRVPATDIEITGEITTLVAGLVDELKITYAPDGAREIHWLIRYSYTATNDVPEWCPSRVSCFWLDDNREMLRDEFIISSLKLQDTPLVQEMFQPRVFLKENSWQVQVYSNNAIYSVSADGTLNLHNRQGGSAQRGRRLGPIPAEELIIVYVASAGANLGICVLAVRMHSKNGINNKTKSMS